MALLSGAGAILLVLLLPQLLSHPVAAFTLTVVMLLGFATALISLIVAGLAYLLSGGLADWLSLKALHRQVRDLPTDARAILDVALANYGARIVLPAGLAETRTLVDAGYFDHVVSRSGVSIFRIRRDLLSQLRAIPSAGHSSECVAGHGLRIELQQAEARTILWANLPAAKICIGPVGRTQAEAAWRDGRLPWRLTPSFPTLERITRERPVIMDRRTWDALPERPLHGRLNIVITRSEQAQDSILMDEGEVADTLDEALAMANEEQLASEGDAVVHIIGGPLLVKAALSRAELLHLTEEEPLADPVASTTFDPMQWQETFRETIPASGKDPLVVHRILSRTKHGVGARRRRRDHRRPPASPAA